MKVLQYTLDGEKDNYSEKENMLVYTGNHDNDTIVGWYNKFNDKDKLKEFLKRENCYDKKIHFSLIKYALKCNGKLVVVPIQDLLGLDTNSRVNIPGTTSNFNWSWKLKSFWGIDRVIKKFSKM